MEMEITFPGGKKVNSTYKGFSVETDQPKNEGGDGSAPELKMTVRFDRNEKKNLVEAVRIHIHLPPGFPEKYKSTVIKVAGLCTVKRNIFDPPEFIIKADIQG